jgi:hypothetical protein
MINEKTFAERMIEKYPLLFPINEMGQPRMPDCGLGCPKGWEPLVEILCSNIHRYVTAVKPSAKIVIAQVKSKFGSLRFYYDGGDEQIRGMVSMAETFSRKISEDSGEIGFLHKNKNGYYRTLTEKEGKKQKFLKV